MIEQIKTLILVLLVASSLYLTYQLWYGQMPTELIAEDVLEEVAADEPRLMEEIVTPSRIITGDDQAFYLHRAGQTGYAVLWTELVHLLQGEKNPLPEEEPDGAGTVETGNRVVFYFDPPLPHAGEWIWVPEGINSEIVQIEVFFTPASMVLIFTGKEAEVIEVSLDTNAGNQFREIHGSLSVENRASYSLVDDDTLSAMYDFEITAAQTFFLPAEWSYPVKISIQPEPINREQILQSFFADYNLARMIEEKDGGLIYTDGEKGLRLTASGFEYSYPRLERGQVAYSYAEALLYSSSLIGYHGGWPQGLRLEKITLVENPRSSYYSVDWRMYYNGSPIYASTPTRAIFNDLGLIHFTRSLYMPVGVMEDEGKDITPAAAWSEALDAALTVFEGRRADFVKNVVVEEICPGYAVVGRPQSLQGEPVWFIQLNGEMFFLTAAELKLLGEGDMQ